jgi:uncharacterized membrane protein (UPF0127 family)
MIVLNQTQGTVVADRAEVADTFWRRGKGLIGRRELAEGSGLVIQPCGSIHMFFMSIPLDVLHIDKHGRVVRVLHGIKPWRLGPIVPSSKWVIELPEGTAQRTSTGLGDVIALVSPAAHGA